MVVGDTNARVGNGNDDRFLNPGSEDREEWQHIHREANADPVVNQQGDMLLNLAHSSTLFLPIGR